MSKIFQPRMWFLFSFLACAGMLAFALYKQHVDFVEPCPLCILQRLGFAWIGLVGLLLLTGLVLVNLVLLPVEALKLARRPRTSKTP